MAIERFGLRRAGSCGRCDQVGENVARSVSRSTVSGAYQGQGPTPSAPTGVEQIFEDSSPSQWDAGKASDRGRADRWPNTWRHRRQPQPVHIWRRCDRPLPLRGEKSQAYRFEDARAVTAPRISRVSSRSLARLRELRPASRPRCQRGKIVTWTVLACRRERVRIAGRYRSASSRSRRGLRHGRRIAGTRPDELEFGTPVRRSDGKARERTDGGISSTATSSCARR